MKCIQILRCHSVVYHLCFTYLCYAECVRSQCSVPTTFVCEINLVAPTIILYHLFLVRSDNHVQFSISLGSRIWSIAILLDVEPSQQHDRLLSVKSTITGIRWVETLV